MSEEALAHSIDDLARRGLGRTKVYEAIREGRLIARKIGRRTVILDDDLRQYLQNLPRADAAGQGGKQNAA